MFRAGLRWQDLALNWRLAVIPAVFLAISVSLSPPAWNPCSWDWSGWLTLLALALCAWAVCLDYSAPLVLTREHLYQWVPGAGWSRLALASIWETYLEVDQQKVDDLGATVVHYRLCLRTETGVAKIWVHPRLDRKLVEALQPG